MAHLPSGRHTVAGPDPQGIGHSVGHWARDGLGYWTARLREDLPGTDLRADAVVGTGGCALRVGTAWWNLYYRFTPAAWGRGLAAELVTAAIDAAHAVAPTGRWSPTCSSTTWSRGAGPSGPGCTLVLARARRRQPRPGRRPPGLRRPADRAAAARSDHRTSLTCGPGSVSR